MKALCGIYFAIEMACEAVCEGVSALASEVSAIVVRTISPR